MRRTASTTAAMGHLRLMGMISARIWSLGALRLMASLGRRSAGSEAKRSIPGTTPEVETVMRCGLRPTSRTSSRTAAMKLS